MFCGTRWLAEFQRRVEKDRSGRIESERGRHKKRAREGKAQKKRDTYTNKGIKDKKEIDKIALKRRQEDTWH